MSVSSMGIPFDFRPDTEEELRMCLADPEWRICSGALYKILVKENDEDLGGKVMPFRPNRAQRRFLRRMHYRNIILKARQLGFCVSPETRVLTADLRWKAIGDIQPGEQVVACDEFGAGGKGQARRMRTAGVVAVRKMIAERFRITFDDGRSVVCTDRHPWLSKKSGSDSKWRSLSGQGNAVTGRLKVGTQVRWIAKPWADPSFEDGWVGGMLDGEGSMAKDCHGAGVNVSQRPGPVWDRLVRYSAENGYSACIESDGAERPGKHGVTPVPKLAFNRMDELFRLIGQTRPTRFIDRRWWEGKELPGKRDSGTGWATITSIESIGSGEVVDMQTTTGTYIAEGFVSHNTTLIAIIWLDHALFNKNQRCAMIAQDLPTTQSLFRDKIKFAYDNLPATLRARMPLATDSKTELLFAHNGSSVKVATSVRSGTIDRLHVSEFGKIAAESPDKAKEVVTGSLPAVPLHGIAIIESTAEGQGGEFHSMVKKAEEHAKSGKRLNPKQFRLHFAAWHDNPEYAMSDRDTADVTISAKEHEYFDGIQAIWCLLKAKSAYKISMAQRAWYISTRDSDFSGDAEKMWQEYPSYPDEAFKVSTEGTYYATQLAAARAQGRIGRFPAVTGVPVNTFWDIGNRDGTAIWFHQKIGAEDRFIGFLEGWEKDYSYFVGKMQETGYIWGVHHLPHDATHKRQQGRSVKSPEDMLRELAPGWSFTIVPRVDDVSWGIQATRDAFSTYTFDETGCKEGLIHLTNYKKEWDSRLAVWKATPRHDEHSEAADAIRQHAQGYTPSAGRQTRPRRRNSSGAVA